MKTSPHRSSSSRRAVSVALLLAGALFLGGCGDEPIEVLRTGSCAEANQAVATIAAQGGHPLVVQRASSRSVLYLVVVPPGEANASRTLLTEVGLPAPIAAAAESGGALDFGAAEQRRRIERERKLESLIEGIEKVIDARVSIAEPKSRDFHSDAPPADALMSVVVRYNAAALAESSAKELTEEIRRLVAQAPQSGNLPSSVEVVTTPVTLTRIATAESDASADKQLRSTKIQRNTLAGASVVMLLGFLGLLFAYQRGMGLRR